MARTRTEMTAEQIARIDAGVRRGESAASIAYALGGVVSGRTIARRMAEIRGPQSQQPGWAVSDAAPQTPRIADMPPLSPDGTPAPPTVTPSATPRHGSTVAELYDLLAVCKQNLELARESGNVTQVNQVSGRIADIAEKIRKATPPERPDPNENPDYRKLAQQVAERLHKMVDAVTELDD